MLGAEGEHWVNMTDIYGEPLPTMRVTMRESMNVSLWKMLWLSDGSAVWGWMTADIFKGKHKMAGRWRYMNKRLGSCEDKEKRKKKSGMGTELMEK